MNLGRGWTVPPLPVAPSGRAVGVVVLVTIGILGVLAALHPELRLVDFAGFSGRASRLAGVGDPARTGPPVLNGGDLVNGLYPVGYPLLLIAGHAVTGDVLLAGKALSVLAGGLAAGALARIMGVGGAMFVLVQLAFLLQGSTEGTDMAAAALAFAALATASRPGATAGESDSRPLIAGLLAGLACDVRYTAVAVLPVLLALLWSRPAPAVRAAVALLAGFTVATAPHWATALVTGASPWPDQSENLTLAAGHPTTLASWETVTRWPGGFGRALADAAGPWPVRLGALGLLVGSWRRDPRALGLLAYALLHCAILGVAFSNPRLVLPATLALAGGVGWLLSARWLAFAGALVGMLNLRPALAHDPQAVEATEAAAGAPTDRPCLATSPWFHTRRPDGWILPSIQLSGLRVAPPTVTPAALRDLALTEGSRCVALDVSRTRGAWPRLAPLLALDPATGATPAPVDGWTLAAATPGWRVWRTDPEAHADNAETTNDGFVPTPWTALAPGIDYATFRLPSPTVAGPPRLDVVRVDPTLADLRLVMASAGDGRPRTPREWARSVGGVAAINAAMFAADGVSTVGYSELDGTVHTSGRAADNNSLFLASPITPDLPSFHLANLECEPWDDLLARHRTALQSIRLLDCAGHNVWSQQPKAWSAALVGMDHAGRGLLLFTRAPYSMHTLVDDLLTLPLDLAALHYGDGGPPASMYIRLPTGDVERVGSYETGVFESDANDVAQAIPNVLVAVPRGAP